MTTNAPEPGAAQAGPHDAQVDQQRAATRSELLPEEERVGSDDPLAQAQAVLEDSETRTEQPGAAPTTVLEHRTSEQTAEPLA